VLDAALKQAAQWQRGGLGLSVAVNVSTRCLLDPTFPDQVTSQLATWQVPPDRLATSPSDAVIVRSTIDLGHNLGLRVVAEDGETQHAWQQLSALGCDIAQGYYLGRAIPAAELEQQLTQLAQAVAEIQADPRPSA
jgi:EAL domain-containing protein (putative c-di-GMP-specific phosphodiesterase class I)